MKIQNSTKKLKIYMGLCEWNRVYVYIERSVNEVNWTDSMMKDDGRVCGKLELCSRMVLYPNVRQKSNCESFYISITQMYLFVPWLSPVLYSVWILCYLLLLVSELPYLSKSVNIFVYFHTKIAFANNLLYEWTFILTMSEHIPDTRLYIL